MIKIGMVINRFSRHLHKGKVFPRSFRVEPASATAYEVDTADT